MDSIKIYLSHLRGLTFTSEGHYTIIKIPDISLAEYSGLNGVPMFPGEKRILDIMVEVAERSKDEHNTERD